MYVIIEQNDSFGASVRGIFSILDEAVKVREQLSKDDNYQSHFDVILANDDHVISFLWKVGRIVRDFYFGKFGIITKCEVHEKYNTDFFSKDGIIKEIVLEVHLENNEIVKYCNTYTYRHIDHLTTFSGCLPRREYGKFCNLKTNEERRDFLTSEQSVMLSKLIVL